MFGYTFYWSLVWDEMPRLLAGAWITIQITVLSVAVGTLLAMPMSVARQKGHGSVCWIATAWVELSRNTPALFQVYLMYFGLGALGININSYAAVLVALSFNNAGYLTEIFRGGMAAIPRQQLAAARALGMTPLQSFSHIIFPQVMRVIFFSFMTQVIWAMLNTSLGMLVGLRDLAGEANYAQSLTYRTFEFFIVTAAMYYLLAKTLEYGSRLLFSRLFRA
jgi:His/Glu/Gln/Arg/opine family amino acid ABC transporter permease subunit